MSPEVALLHDLWDSIKSQITSKERLAVAEEMVRCFDEYVDITDYGVDINEFDKTMKAALLSHFDDGEEEDDEYDEEY